MKVKDLKKMLEKYDDEVELVFIGTTLDRDGWSTEVIKSVHKVLNKETCYYDVKHGMVGYHDK